MGIVPIFAWILIGGREGNELLKLGLVGLTELWLAFGEKRMCVTWYKRAGFLMLPTFWNWKKEARCCSSRRFYFLCWTLIAHGWGRRMGNSCMCCGLGRILAEVLQVCIRIPSYRMWGMIPPRSGAGMVVVRKHACSCRKDDEIFAYCIWILSTF